jgi:hypothetical protein
MQASGVILQQRSRVQERYNWGFLDGNGADSVGHREHRVMVDNLCSYER